MAAARSFWTVEMRGIRDGIYSRTLELARMANKKLLKICEKSYFAANLAITSDKTRKQYRIALELYGRYLGRSPRLSDLSDDSLQGFIRWLQDNGRAPNTINDRAGRIKTLWTWLAKRRLVELFPTVGTVKVPHRRPLAWTEDELRKLFGAIQTENLDVAGISGRDWWHTFHCLAWNSGERVTALLSTRWEWLSGDTLTIPAEVRKSKTKDMAYRLWPSTLAVLESFRHDNDLILPWTLNYPATFYSRYDRILKRAGLPINRRSKCHRMRVSHATYVMATTGKHAANLGHASSATTVKHYEDPRFCEPVTPELFTPWKEVSHEQC